VLVYLLKEQKRGRTEVTTPQYTSDDWKHLLQSVPLRYHYAGYALFAVVSLSGSYRVLRCRLTVDREVERPAWRSDESRRDEIRIFSQSIFLHACRNFSLARQPCVGTKSLSYEQAH